MPISGFSCHVCGAPELQEVAEFRSLPRVTSDCKPFPPGGRLAVCAACGAIQKPADADWRADTVAIYRDYDIYFQSGGVEQAVFDPARGVPRLRSRVLLERVHQVRPFGSQGSLIDVGCGKGTFLKAFSEFQPGWRLFGHELSDTNAPFLAGIDGFQRLYTGDFSDLPGSFDVITMVHALEHFDDPLGGLRVLATKLSPGGVLVVEVPDAGVSAFDLAVADHASHFTRADLTRLAFRAGLTPLALTDDWMAKELSLVARRSAEATAEPPAIDGTRVYSAVSSRIGWLHGLLGQAREAARGAPRFGIFGTSVVAMWLLGELGDEVDFFVDEDPSRIGELHGRPVVTPDKIPEQATVYFALLPEIAAVVAARVCRADVVAALPRPTSAGRVGS